MTPDTPLTIQWFAYALAENGVLDDEGAQNLRAELNNTTDLAEFAQAVVERLCEGVPEAEQEGIIEQIQPLVDYACGQAETGIAPDSAVPESAAPEAVPVPAAAAEETAAPLPPDEELKRRGREGLVLAMPDFDLSGIEGYENLPSLSDTSQLDDAQVAERMMYMLACLRKLGCSDFHLSAGAPPFVRRALQIERLDSYILTPEDSKRLNFALLSDGQREYFLANQDMNLALELGTSRFRVCLMEQKEGLSGSYRLVPDHLCTLEELGYLPKDAVHLKRLLDYNNGLILVTGPIGAGKTTTLAAMTDLINQKRQDHIISVEDPIEILQLSKNCQVTQREIGRHTNNYHAALKAALREDPDIIIIGEMNDLETIENAITAAETGHLVIGTLHTGNAPNTLDRLLDVFPPQQQSQIRAMTAGSLRGVVCQKMVPDGFGGIVLIYEIMLNNMSVANIITEGKTFRLQSTMVTANKIGMCTFDQCILEKYSQNLITREAALSQMSDESIITQLNSIWAQREAAALKAAKRK